MLWPEQNDLRAGVTVVMEYSQWENIGGVLTGVKVYWICLWLKINFTGFVVLLVFKSVSR